MDNQQGPTVGHREFYSILCNHLNGKRIWKRIDTCIFITVSLCCTPKTNTTLLINYTPIKNSLKKKKQRVTKLLKKLSYVISRYKVNQWQQRGYFSEDKFRIFERKSHISASIPY